jgi:5-methylcytosine-specific restriction endonuclease McrA
MKEQILKLRSEGKSYREIAAILNCTKSLVCYYCNSSQKQKSLDRTRKRRKGHPYLHKLDNFLFRKSNLSKIRPQTCSDRRILTQKLYFFNGENIMNKITVDKLIERFSEYPKCYLTGKNININKPRTYHFDHKVPTSRGGTNTIENLGICTKEANQAKSDMTHDEFVEFCKSVLIHHGYIVSTSPQP